MSQSSVVVLILPQREQKKSEYDVGVRKSFSRLTSILLRKVSRNKSKNSHTRKKRVKFHSIGIMCVVHIPTEMSVTKSDRVGFIQIIYVDRVYLLNIYCVHFVRT